MEKWTSLLAEGNPYSNSRLTNTLKDSKTELAIVVGGLATKES